MKRTPALPSMFSNVLFTNQIRLISKNKGKFYSQIAVRMKSIRSSNMKNRCGFVVGYNHAWHLSNMKLRWIGEYRFYGKHFNDGFWWGRSSFVYRSGWEYARTIGAQLYPLQNYLRPFSQWAAYTNYQRRSVHTIIIRSCLQHQLTHQFALELNTDFNVLDVSGEDLFVYPFFEANLLWQPTKVIAFVGGFSNKGMNLDRTFQTFYLYKYPALMLSFRYHLEIK